MKGFYSILDTKAGVFCTPFLEFNDGTAMRSFADLCSDPKTVFAKYPADYQLFCVGEWDEFDGKLQAVSPRSITNGSSVILRES